MLSPHTTSSWQGLPGGLHEYPGSTARQLAWQPSLGVVFPSSHASSSVSVPSPQPAGAGASGLQGEPGSVGSHTTSGLSGSMLRDPPVLLLEPALPSFPPG